MRYLVTMGVGLWPGAPGTYGSALTALGLAAWLRLLGPLDGWAYGAVVLALGAAALWGCRAALAMGIWGADKDPSSVVIDEAVGIAIAAWGIDALDWRLAFAFAAFRFFDILKPFPVGRSQRLPGEWGIVIDDVLAGVYAAALMALVRYCWPGLAAI